MSDSPSSSLPAQLPPLPSVEEIQRRLAIIFPEEFPNRKILVGQLAARVIFVCLYGGAVEGRGQYMRPSHVYLFTEEQATKTTDEERLEWAAKASKQSFRPVGTRWYADTSKEGIRDDLMRNQLIRLGIMQQRSGIARTASTPISYLAADFATLFAPALDSDRLVSAIKAWAARHLDKATQQRMALKASGISAKGGDLFVDMPDGERIRITAGPSSIIAKDLIEQFAQRHLESPAVIWLSFSDKKSLPQYVERAATVGLKFDLNAELPDLIFADMKDPIRFLFCEIVATDGPVTEARKEALLGIVRDSHIPEGVAEFLTAFEDREAGPFRKSFSQLAVDSLVWFRTEPDLLVILSTTKP